jgi:NAD(P)-dependent dehydrogenase (short-subunit alcohol dehydrogenase family)
VTQTVAVTGARSGITRTTAVQFAARVPKSHCCQRDRSGSCGVLTLPLLGNRRQAGDAAEEVLYLPDHLDEGVGGDRFRDVAVGVQSIAVQHVFVGAGGGQGR